jgi:hypothetical protein
LNRIGAQKSQSLNSVKDTKVPEVRSISDKLRADTLAMKLTPNERSLVENFIGEIEGLGKAPTLGSVDKTVDLLQNTLFEKSGNLSIPVTGRIQSLVNSSIGKLNDLAKSTAEKALGGSKEYTVLNDAYSTKKDLFDRLNKAIGEDNQKGGSLFKKFFSPQDAGTKKLFSEINDTYGIDLGEDATLAKFVMDSLGDVRSKSLLEQIPMSKSGVVNKVLQKVEKKLTNPIGKARNTIQKRENKSKK